MSFLTSTASSSNTTWFPTIITSSYVPKDNWYLTNTTTSTSASITLTLPNYKKCRECNHIHLEGQSGCVEVLGLTNSITFVTCSCKEYLPKDNLEYLEYLDKKKENK